MKRIEVWYRQIPRLAALLLVALTSGCATPTLWQRTSAFKWQPNLVDKVLIPADTNQPCAPLVLFSQTADIPSPFLFSRNVGWRVGQPPEDVAGAREAVHEFTKSAAQFKSVPVYVQGQVPANASSRPPGYAAVNYGYQNSNSQFTCQLTFHIDGVPAGPYNLPTSQHPKNTAERWCLTPFAVVLDVPISACALVIFAAALASH